MKRTGDTVAINGKEYTLGAKIGGGAEGAVFEVVDIPGYVIKLLNDSRMNGSDRKAILNRLKWLKERVGENTELKQNMAVPKALLDEDLGYIMVKAGEHQKLGAYFNYPKDEKAFKIWLKDSYCLKKRLQIGSFLFHTLERIHISGLIFTDLSPNNIMVHKDKNNLVFIDVDNMRRKDDAYTNVLGTPRYAAPEIYRNELNRDGISDEMPQAGKLSVDSDIFSAAVIIFELLTLQHPFIGDAVEAGTPEEEDEAIKGKTDYILHRNGFNQCSTNPFVFLFKDNITVTEALSGLFYRTFVDGKEQPRLRPTAVEFYEAFANALDILIKCPQCGVERIYNEKIENKCWNCDELLSDPVLLKIFDDYEEKNRAALIAKIAQCSIEDISNDTESISKAVNSFALSKIALQEVETKYLYLRHFEKTNNRSNVYAAVTLIDAVNGTVRIQIAGGANCGIVDKTNGKITPISADKDKAFEFRYDRYDIYFEITDSRVGKIKTVGRFLSKLKGADIF